MLCCLDLVSVFPDLLSFSGCRTAWLCSAFSEASVVSLPHGRICDTRYFTDSGRGLYPFLLQGCLIKVSCAGMDVGASLGTGVLTEGSVAQSLKPFQREAEPRCQVTRFSDQ